MTDLFESILSTYENADFEKIALHRVFHGVDRADFETRNKLILWLAEKLVSQQKKKDRDQADLLANEAWKVHRIVQETGDPHFPREAREFVARYLAHHKIAANFKGKLSRPRIGSTAPDFDSTHALTELEAISQELRFGFNGKALSHALTLELKEVKDTIRESTFLNITQPFDAAEAEAHWERLAHATMIIGTGEGNVSARYAIRVMQTTIWLTKRKLVMDADLPAEGHLMPVLYGEQGCGKTDFSRRFFSPVGGMVAEVNFADVTDKKNHDLAGMPIAFLDEMEKADKADVEAIKNAITSKERSSRVHHSHGMAHMDNRTNYFGCSNKTVGQTIVDPTGLRRFGPLPFRFAPTRENIANGLLVADWATINEIDYLLLWRSVDHTAAHPLMSDPEAKKEWEALTEQERQRDGVEEWLRQVHEGLPHEWVVARGEFKSGVVGGYSPDAQFKVADLFQCYRVFCESNRVFVLSLQAWGRALASHENKAWFPFTPTRRLSSGMVRNLKPSEPQEDAGDVVSLFPDQEAPPTVSAPSRLPKLNSAEVAKMLKARGH